MRSLIAIAQARGWTEVTVSGTKRFRGDAWRQGRLAGLHVRGYRPSAIERAQLARALARGSEAPEVGLRRESGPEAAPSDAIRPVTPLAPQEARPNGTRAKGTEDRIVGKLLDHGLATYRHDPHEALSYYVKIQTPEGRRREIWGRDLERAMGKSLSQPQIGEQIVLQKTGREPVTVKRRQRDSRGRVTKNEGVSAYRNRWLIERSDFIDARAAAASALRDPSIEPARAVRQHPQLAGTYLNLRAAEIAALAARDPEDRRRFVAAVRSVFADEVERGEPLRGGHLRERTRTPRSRGGREPPESTPGRG